MLVSKKHVWFSDGWLDEFRVSTVVRGFENVPVLAEHGWPNGNLILGEENPITGS